MCAQSVESFKAIDVVDQIELVRLDGGSGATCSSIHAMGNSIASENRRISRIAGWAPPWTPVAAKIRMIAAATAKAASTRAPASIANIGVAASKMISRRKAIDKWENFRNVA